MKQIIQKISIEDFRSFKEAVIEFEDATCIIGPNEGGKTNLLDVVNMLTAGLPDDVTDKRVMKTSDTRKNSVRFNNNQLPILRFTISKDLIKNEELKSIFQINDKPSIELIRIGNNFSIEIEPNLDDADFLIDNLTPQDIEITSSSNKLLLHPSAWKLFKSSEYEIIKPEIDRFLSEGKIDLKNKDQIKQTLVDLLLQEVKNNLKVFFWGYDKEKYGLLEIINIQEFLSNPTAKLAVLSIFRLAGYDVSDLSNLFSNGKSETDFENTFSEISKKVTEEIQKAWPPNPNIKINIIYKTDHLLINIEEPGYAIEPKYRSEGLQWFLAFLIGMLAQAKELMDYIIIIDEPALHLHPGGQKAVLAKLNELALNNQIIYSTHSPFMVDRRYPGRVKILTKDTSTGYSMTKVEEPKKENILRDPLLLSAFGYSITDLSYLSNKNILVEGLLEKKIIELLIRKFIDVELSKETINLNEIAIIDCSGAGEIEKHARLYKEGKLICISMYDSDSIGESCKKANINKKIQTPEEIISLSEIQTNLITFEDLIPETVYIKAFKDYFNLRKSKKLNGYISLPRRNGFDQLINKKVSQNSKDLDENQRKEKKIAFKKEFEEKIVNSFNDFLSTHDLKDKELSLLKKLHDKIKEKLDCH